MKSLSRAAVALALVLAASCGESSSGTGDLASAPDGGGGGACATDRAPPKVTSSSAGIGFPVGDTTASHTFVFDEPVTIAADGIVVEPAASLTVTPALPATGTTFTVSLAGLADGASYSVRVPSAKAADACGNALAADAAVKVVSGCEADKTPPTVTSAAAGLVFPGGTTTAKQIITFSESVKLAAGAVSVNNGATATVTPTLPAVGASLEVDLTGLDDKESYDVTIHAASVTDRCGNALAADSVTRVEGQCVSDTTRPKITSKSQALRFGVGATSVAHTFTFDEPVSIAAGQISVDNGATVTVTPPLPATASSFAVTVNGLAGAASYTLKPAPSIVDRCGNQLVAGPWDIPIVACQGDSAAPALATDDVVLSCGTPTLEYVLSFDEVATLDTGALSIDGGATIASVVPALPATSDKFTVSLANLTATHTLTVATGKLADECGNSSAAPVTVSVGVGPATGNHTFGYTGTIANLVVPRCPSTTIEASGAQGGQNASSTATAGLGARLEGTFSATTLASRQLKLLVGEQPSTASGNGGGGGSFVVGRRNQPIMIASGGGGSGDGDGAHKAGSIEPSGQSCVSHGGGVGGAGGNGGAKGASGFQSGAGGGFLTSGADGWAAGTGGSSFPLGGAGGIHPTNTNARGGFGGGGAGSSFSVGGAGGGYSGGGACSNAANGSTVGAGGGSLNTAPNAFNSSGVRAGHGQIVVSWH